MIENAKKPNFFIIGAPKCGTSSLSAYLRDHADIFFSNPKEPNYFLFDFSDKQRKVLDEVEYLSLFNDAETEKAIGEGSVWYLYSKVAVSNILKLNPEAKFVVMVRNPVDMFVSLYDELFSNFEENATTLLEAWELQDERSRGNLLPAEVRDPKVLQYGKICKTGEQVERLLQTVPQEKVLVVFFDDLKQNTRSVYQRVLIFLNIADDNRADFPVINKRKKVNHKNLHKFIKFLGKVKRTLKIKKSLNLLNTLKNQNKKEVGIGHERMSESFRTDLKKYFREDIQKLSRLTGRDLTHWY